MSTASEPLRTATAPERASILLVDDRPANLLAIEAVLEPLGVTIVRASTPEQALRAVESQTFAVILLDVQMPGMDGYEVARRIQTLDAPRLTPIIFITALDEDRRHVHAGYESGAVDYLFKPLDPDVLRGKVQAFVRLYQERAAEASRERSRYADLAEQAAQARAALILESITDAFYAVDADFCFTYLNGRAEEWWGRPRSELLGKKIWDEFPQAVGTETHRRLLEAMRERQPLHFETTSPTHGDWIEVSVYPEAEGGLSCYFRDVGARKRAEEERERLLAAERTARTEADAASRVKSEFLATMSHELRTPLNALIGYADLLEAGVAGPMNDQQHKYLERLQASGRHLLGLVNDVLDVARTDAGQASVAQERGMTGTAVASALALAAPQAAECKITLVDARQGEAGEPYFGDADRVRQILVNLLGNAVKFTAAGGRVTVHCGRAKEAPAGSPLRGRGPWTYVRVEDTGVGIPPEEQARIFEPFHQVERGHTRTRGGTGLGLAISRRYARLMGGDLTVESTPGAGSAFTLWLPVGERSGSADAEQTHADEAAPQYQVRGLKETGELLREELQHILEAYASRLRSDPATPGARTLRTAELEDHQATLAEDLAQSLIIIAGAGAEAAELMRDGSAIQRVVAEHHGRRRHAQGWTEEGVRRDCDVLREEIDRAIRARVPAGRENVSDALRVLGRLIDRAREQSVAAWQQAHQRATR